MTGDRDAGSNGIVAVVTAFNEAGRVASTVTALRTIPGVREVIVVDDGSRDATASEAGRAGARVIRLSHNRGKGAALASGVAASRSEIVLLADADLGVSAANLQALITPVRQGDADVAIAAPAPGAGPSGFGLVEALARRGIARRTGRTMRRPLSGQRAVRSEVFSAVRAFAPGFGAETAFTLDAIRAGYRVVEVPCEFSHTRTGRDLAGFAHRARQGIDVIGALFGRRIR